MELSKNLSSLSSFLYVLSWYNKRHSSYVLMCFYASSCLSAKASGGAFAVMGGTSAGCVDVHQKVADSETRAVGLKEREWQLVHA